VNCGAVHSQAREIVAQGYTATLVAATLAISRSSLYYRKQPRKSRADRQFAHEANAITAAANLDVPVARVPLASATACKYRLRSKSKVVSIRALAYWTMYVSTE